MSKDPFYYFKREATERELADAATDPRVRAVHVALADRYSELANQDLLRSVESPRSLH